MDVVEFDRLVADGRLSEAGQLVHGDLLTGFDDDWVVQAREDRRSAAAGVFEQLAIDAQENDHQIDVAIGWARRHLALEPFAEVAQQRLMRLLAAKGDRTAALAEYDRFRDRLAGELRVAPSAQTRRLAEDLALPPQRRAAAAQFVRALPLVGRDQELRRLLAAWQRARDGSGSVVMISGEPGIGKTRLAAELVERARAEGARTASTAALDLGGGAPLTMRAELIGDLTAELDAPPLDVAWPSALEVLVPDLGRRFGRRSRGAVERHARSRASQVVRVDGRPGGVGEPAPTRAAAGGSSCGRRRQPRARRVPGSTRGQDAGADRADPSTTATSHPGGRPRARVAHSSSAGLRGRARPAAEHPDRAPGPSGGRPDRA